MSENEIATDIRTAGELVEVLSKLPEHTPVKVMDGDWGYGHYLNVDVVDGEVYLGSQSGPDCSPCLDER